MLSLSSQWGLILAIQAYESLKTNQIAIWPHDI
jgi:hypothetical protein